MKKLILLFAAITLVSCSTPEIDQPKQPYGQVIQDDCGTIIASGEDQRGDYICVRFEYHNPSQYNRYGVANYQAYQLNTKICNFDGLVKEAN